MILTMSAGIVLILSLNDFHIIDFLQIHVDNLFQEIRQNVLIISNLSLLTLENSLGIRVQVFQG